MKRNKAKTKAKSCTEYSTSFEGDDGIPVGMVLEGSRTGLTYYVVNDGQLVCCFQKTPIDEKAMEFLAERKPKYMAVMESIFMDDAGKINFEGIFRKISPRTKLYIL